MKKFLCIFFSLIFIFTSVIAFDFKSYAVSYDNLYSLDYYSTKNKSWYYINFNLLSSNVNNFRIYLVFYQNSSLQNGDQFIPRFWFVNSDPFTLQRENGVDKDDLNVNELTSSYDSRYGYVAWYSPSTYYSTSIAYIPSLNYYRYSDFNAQYTMLADEANLVKKYGIYADVDLGVLNYSIVDLVGDRQSISLQFNGTSTGLENGEFDVEYAIMDNSYAYDTSFNAVTGQITGRSFFDWSNGSDPSTGDSYEMSDPDIGDWFLSGFLVSPNWNNINTDEVTVTDTLIPALTKNFYHKLSDPVNIGSPDIYAFSYPGNISDHMDSYQYRNHLTGYNYMPSYSIYVRPVKDNNVGQWSVVSWYMNQNNEAVVSKTTPSQNSNNMPTNNSVQTITQNGYTYNIVNNTYPDGTTDYPVIDPIFSLPEIPSIETGEHDKEDSDILEKLLELIEAMKQFPDFLSMLFEFFKALLGWLPASVINIIRFGFMFLFILILVRAVKIIV